jgi:hypothetical protein
MKLTWKRLFWKDDDGTILAEALLVIPSRRFPRAQNKPLLT